MNFAPYPEFLRALQANGHPVPSVRATTPEPSVRARWRGLADLAWHVRRWATLDTSGLPRTHRQAAA
jgi:hypothetical protein